MSAKKSRNLTSEPVGATSLAYTTNSYLDTTGKESVAARREHKMPKQSLVQIWLGDTGLSTNVLQTFEAAGIVNPKDLAELEIGHYPALGVKEPGDRKKLFYLVQQVKREVSETQENDEQVKKKGVNGKRSPLRSGSKSPTHRSRGAARSMVQGPRSAEIVVDHTKLTPQPNSNNYSNNNHSSTKTNTNDPALRWKSNSQDRDGDLKDRFMRNVAGSHSKNEPTPCNLDDKFRKNDVSDGNGTNGDGGGASPNENSTIVTDPLFTCRNEQGKKSCLVDIQRILDNDPNFKELDWSDRHVGAYGAKVLVRALAENSLVTRLDLDTNDIGADGAKVIAEALKRNSSVTYINLWGNKLGADGAKAIAEALKTNSSVTEINLRYNRIGDNGSKAIAEALKKNSSVTNINLSSNGISADGVMAVAEALAENSSVTVIHLYGNNISPTDEALITTKTASNTLLKKHQEDVRKNNDGTKTLPNLSYYIDEISATSSPSHHDNNSQWKWTSAAWEAVNDGDGRVAQVLLNCLKENTNTTSDFRQSLKQLVETDFNKKQKKSLLHIAAGQPYHKVVDLLRFFVEHCKVKIDLTDEEGRSIAEIAIANDNREISAWARKFGTYLERYDIEGWNGLDSDPIHQSETCTVHFATAMEKKVIPPELATIEFQPEETLDGVKKKLKEKRNKRNKLEEEDDDNSETYKILELEIKVLQGKYKILNKSEGADRQQDYHTEALSHGFNAYNSSCHHHQTPQMKTSSSAFRQSNGPSTNFPTQSSSPPPQPSIPNKQPTYPIPQQQHTLYPRHNQDINDYSSNYNAYNSSCHHHQTPQMKTSSSAFYQSNGPSTNFPTQSSSPPPQPSIPNKQPTYPTQQQQHTLYPRHNQDINDYSSNNNSNVSLSGGRLDYPLTNSITRYPDLYQHQLQHQLQQQHQFNPQYSRQTSFSSIGSEGKIETDEALFSNTNNSSTNDKDDMPPSSRVTMMPPVSPKIFEQDHLCDSPTSLRTAPYTSTNGNSTRNNDGENDGLRPLSGMTSILPLIARATMPTIDKPSPASSVSPTSTITTAYSTPPPTPSTRRPCLMNGCTNKNVQGGRCISHGAKRRTCGHLGCPKHVKTAGMCSKHGPARNQCNVRGCKNVLVQAGRCNSHGVKKKLCSAKGCQKQATLSWMCKQHNDEKDLDRLSKLRVTDGNSLGDDDGYSGTSTNA